MKTHTILAAITAFFLAATVGLAATKFQEKQFSAGDTDGDKHLSKGEYVAVKTAGAKKNAAKNNKEFDAATVGKRQAKQFAKHDSNGDRKLSSDEFFASFPAKKK